MAGRREIDEPRDDVGAQLTAWGRVATIEVRGRVSGRLRRTAVGFYEEPDGSLVIAAGEPGSQWAKNLLAEPRCAVTIGARTFPAIAEPLTDAESERAVTSMILKYGTPAERLGRGQAFRLRPTDG